MSVVSLKPIILPIEGIVWGATFRVAFNLTEPIPDAEPNADGTLPQQALDMTGGRATLIVRDGPGVDDRTIFRIVAEIPSPQASGRVILHRPAADMRIGDRSRRNAWYYELWVYEANGDQGVPFAGPFELEPAAKTT